MTIGGTQTLTADLTPSDTTQTGVNWSVVSGSVSFVGGSTGKQVDIRADGVGAAVVKATSTANAGVFDTFEITVNSLPPQPITSLTIAPSADQTITYGEKVSFNASFTDTGDSSHTAPDPSTVRWYVDSVFANKTGLSFEFDPSVVGTFSVQARVEAGAVTGQAAVQSGSVQVTVNKAETTAPSAPTFVSKTDTSIVVSGAAGVEFSINGGSTWQDSGTFTGLTPDTDYSIVARVKATSNHNASPESSALAVKTYATVGSISVTPETAELTYSGTADSWKQTLTAVVLDNHGTATTNHPYTMQWTTDPADGSSVSATGVATFTKAGTYVIKVQLMNGSTEVASDTSTITVKKGAGAVITSVTGSYVQTGETFTYTIDPITGAEYSKDGTTWQASSVFTGILPNSSVTFYARIAESATNFAGDFANTGAVTFPKLDQAAPSLTYSMSGTFPGTKIITIHEVTGAEYKFNSGAWGSNREYTSTGPEDVTMYIRMTETATKNASPEASLTINTANQNQPAPGPFTMTYTPNAAETGYTVTLPVVANAEYSFDGVIYSDNRTLTDAAPGSTVTGYIRIKAKEGYNASPAATAQITLPLFKTKAPATTASQTVSSFPISVTLTSATPGAVIYYTLDGSTPTHSSSVYEGPIVLTGPAVIKAFAAMEGKADSDVVTLSFKKKTSDYYSILATAGLGGKIDPAGWITVKRGEYKTFTIKPDYGYMVDKVVVDGQEVTLENGTYTFRFITRDGYINATFKKLDTPYIPKTGDTDIGAIGFVMVFAALAAGALAFILKNRKKHLA